MTKKKKRVDINLPNEPIKISLGLKGEDGKSITGAQGIPGPSGVQGEQGEDGPKGEQGDTGQQGDPGLDGKNGLDIDPNVLDGVTVQVNQNTNHREDPDKHFDSKEQKENVIDHLDKDHRTTVIGGGGISIHNNLTGKQGGKANEFFHLTENDINNLETLTNGSNSDDLHIHHYVDRDFVNGTFRESFDCVAESDGSTIVCRLIPADNPSVDDLTMQFSDGDTILQTPVSLVLSAGSDTSPQANYIYIPVDTKVLTKNTSNWPTEEHIKVSYFFVPSATEVQNEGPFITQNWNDFLKNGSQMGHLAHMGERIRYSGANYFSGLDPNGQDQDTTTSYFNFIGNSESYFKITSGVIYQLHKHLFDAFDSQSVDDDIHVVNWNGTSYNEISNIADIVADSAGGSLSNKYFNLFFFAIGNKTGTYDPVMCMLPGGSYVTRNSAENDVDGFDNLVMPREFALDSSTGVPICRMTLKWSGGTTTLNHISTTDLRISGLVASGGTGGATTDFADNQFTVFDQTDITKIIAFDAGVISTSTTRTYTYPDVSGTIITDNNPGDLDHNSLNNYVATEHLDHAFNLDADLIMWLRMDDISGSVVTDFTANGNNGTLVNSPTRADGVIGKSIILDGINQHIVVASSASINANFSEFAIAMRVKPGFIPGHAAHYRVFDKHTGVILSFRALFVGGGAVLRFQTTTTVGTVNCDATVAWDLDSWHHIVMTYDGSFMRLYWDGVLAVAAQAQTGNIDNGAGNFFVGTEQVLSGFFDGEFDDVMFFSRNITSDEALELFELGVSDATTTLTSAYFKEYVASRSGYFNNLHAGSIAASEDIRTGGTFVSSDGSNGITQNITIIDNLESEHSFQFKDGILINYSEE